MELVKKVGDSKVYKKKSGRFGVQSKNRKWINGDDKTAILVEAGLVKVSKASPKPIEEVSESEDSAAE